MTEAADDDAPAGLTLADGTVIGADGRPVATAPEELLRIDSSMPIAEERRVHELPASPKRMNAIAAMVAYHLYGLPNADIAHVLNTNVQMVEMMSKSAEFEEMKTAMLRQLTTHLSSEVRGMLTSHSHIAARKMIEMLDNGNAMVRINAAKDILDRSGHRPADVIEHRHNFDAELRIEYVTKTESATPEPAVTIDAEYE